MNRTIFFILVPLFFFSVVGKAQYPHPAFKQYTVEEGLPSSDVYQVKQDSKGYIWFATGNGVSRFNGYTFENFSMSDGLPDNTNFEIFEDPAKRTWFVPLSCKLSYYENGKIYSYKYNDTLQKLFKKTVKTSFAVDKKGTVYIGMFRDGIYEISGKGVIRHYNDSNDTTLPLTVIRPDSVHFVYSMNGTKKNVPSHLIRFNTNLIHKAITIPDDIHALNPNARMIAKRDNSILFSSEKKLYEFKSNGDFTIENFNYRILWMYEDADNDLWIGTYLGGVYYVHNHDFKNKSQYLNGFAVTGILQDREGGFWFSTEGNGVFYTPSKNILTFDKISGIFNDKINCLANADGQVYAGTQDGFVYAIGDSITRKFNTNTPDDLANNIGNLFYDPLYKQLVVSGKTESGWIKNNIFYNNTSPFGDFNDIAIDAENNYWVATSASLNNLVSDKTKLQRDFAAAPMIIKRVNALLYTKNHTLLLGETDGLWQYNTYTKMYTPPDSTTKLLGNRILGLAYTPDSLLVIGTKGVGLLIDDNGKIYQIDKKKGLCGDNVYKVFCEAANIWVATNNGLNKITIKSKLPFQYELKSYTTADGIASNEVNAVLKVNNTIWVATNKGLSVFRQEQKLKAATKIPLYITKIVINDSSFAVAAAYELAHSQNNIKIYFTGLGFKDAGKLQYRYKMQGLDTAWTYSQNREVQYTTLPPNNYRFLLSVLNSSGEWEAVPVHIDFVIRYPFWQKWWFRIAALLLIVLLADAFFKYRVDQIKQQEERNSELNKTFLNLKLKALRAQMNPHFTFNVMNSIQHFILTKDNEAANRYLSKFSRLIRSILNNSENNTIPVAEELKALELYLELEAMRFENRFSYEIIIDKTIELSKTRIPSMLIQPYVENAIKHGILSLKENGKIKIEITRHTDLLKCVIEDNGVGRAKAAENNKMKQHRSMGTSLTKERLTVINELNNSNLSERTIDLFDENNNAAGTRVEIYIPIN